MLKTFVAIVAAAFVSVLAMDVWAESTESETAAESGCGSDKKPSRRSYREKTSAEAIFRCEFTIPEECEGSVKFRERVVLEFDILTNGKPANISIIKSTNDCLNIEAVRTLSFWHYEPLAEPELDARVTFRVYSHSDAHENQRTMREIGRFN